MKNNSYCRILLIILLFVLPALLVAQEGKVYVSISGGVSIPMLDYAESDFDNESSGFARTGGNLKIDFGYGLNDYLSLAGMFTGGVNRFDYIKLQDYFNENYSIVYPDRSWVVESKSWGIGGMLVGVTGHLPLVTNKLFLEAKALGGLIYVYSPERFITGAKEGEEDIIIKIGQYASPSWALDGGLGLKYHRTRSQYFILMADYLFGNPYYSGVETTPENVIKFADEFSQRVSTLNITIGLGYIIN